MVDELGARERRYVEAYLELEAGSSAAPKGARERALAAMLAEADAVEHEAPPRASRPGVWVAAGLGLCAAAAALAWWVGRVSLVEEHARRVHDQAPLVTHGDRAVHEAAASRQSGGMAPARSSSLDPAEPVAAEPAVEPVPAPPVATDVGPNDARASLPRRSEAEPEPTTARRRPHVEPDEPAPTLSDAEVALLERARRLTQQGEHAAALAVLREHARSHPRSVLGPERTAEQVAVLCRMGAASAESARATFMAGDPPQYLRSRVEKACAP